MSIKYFAEMLRPGDDRDALLFYAGMFSAFDDLFGSSGVGNQTQATDYQPDKPQYITFMMYSETDPMPDTGTSFDVFADGTVTISEIASYSNPGCNERTIDVEQYESTVQNVVNWLRAQPPRLHAYLK